MTAFTKVEIPALTSNKISIRAYFDPQVSNMGLEKHGMSLHDGVLHAEQLACLENNGIKRYVTGLNEFAPSVKKIANAEERTAKVNEIRSVVAELEKSLAANILDVDDEQFWNKVKLCKPDDDTLWEKIEVKVGNKPVYLDPVTNPYDLITIYAIDAGGFSLIAPSLAAAQKMARPPKFYLDRHEETVSSKNVERKLRNKALSALQELYDTDATKLLYVTKVIDPGSPQYKKATSNDTLYETMDAYINGDSFERKQKVAAQNFLNVSKQGIGVLKLRALVKDATYYKFITLKGDGHIYHTTTATLLGRNPADVVEYLQNPLNEEILVMVQDSVEQEWNK